MPAQKRPHEGEQDDPLQSIRNNYHYEQDEDGVDGTHFDQPTPDSEHSDRSASRSSRDKDEFVVVKLAEIRKEVQCPICLGIIRKTRTVMECLHRFCRECIDKSMRLGNNECPACRTHCASRRSLRDDPNYDALIAALYPDIDKYEKEELTFHEEEKARNSQIQASISQTFRRQSEALGRKRVATKATAGAFLRQPDGNYRSAHTRGRRNYRAVELQGSDDEDDEIGHDYGKYSSSDEHVEPKPKRCKRPGNARSSLPFMAASTVSGCGEENDGEASRDSLGVSGGLAGTSDVLAWGKGGMRSHTRYGGLSGIARNARNARLVKIVDYFRHLEDANSEMDVHLMLVSFDEQQIPTLQRPYLCCRSTLSIRHLCQYVARHAALQDDEVEILEARERQPQVNPDPSTSVSIATIVDTCRETLRVLEAQETLAELVACKLVQGHLLLVYRKSLGPRNLSDVMS